ncbi:hypothetical protein WIS52_27835 [Pseudonocardia nematodicida]|uniref:Secreted protein n=1 Tax=Pseudonocardia nematodicida TaxID=1206997 RepID=A0ABV1KIK7_9PSEU
MNSWSLVLRTVAWCVGTLLVGAGLLTAVVVGFGALVGEPEAYSEPDPETVLTDFTRLATTDPAAALRSCTPARGTDFDALAGSLRPGAVPDDQRYLDVDGDLTFLSAPVGGAGDDGDRAVWVYGRQGFAAVSDDARRLSPDLPGPQAYGVTAEAPGAVRVATCVEAAERVEASGLVVRQGPVAPTSSVAGR